MNIKKLIEKNLALLYHQAIDRYSFKKRHNYCLSLKDPKTFNQKIFFRKRYGNQKLMADIADKVKVREYVKDRVGEEILIPLLFVYDFDSISSLKNDVFGLSSCVIKTNFGSGSNHIEIINDETTNFDLITQKFSNAMKSSFGYRSGEYFYDKIDRKVLVEEFIGLEGVPDDYKIHCFRTKHRVVMYVQVDSGRFGKHTRNIYDSQWNLTQFTFSGVKNREVDDKPANLDEMLSIASALSEGFDYIRVDLYNIKGKIYFGEMTQTHNSGMAKFSEGVDEYWGKLWKLDPESELYSK